MTAGYQVIHDDLGNAANTFQQESSSFSATEGNLKPPMADTGDPALNDTLSAVLAHFAMFAEVLRQAMAKHGANLQTCHDGYKSTEADVRALFDTVYQASSINF